MRYKLSIFSGEDTSVPSLILKPLSLEKKDTFIQAFNNRAHRIFYFRDESDTWVVNLDRVNQVLVEEVEE